MNSFKKDINSKDTKSILKKLTRTKKVRSKIIKLKQDIDKPDFGKLILKHFIKLDQMFFERFKVSDLSCLLVFWLEMH